MSKTMNRADAEEFKKHIRWQVAYLNEPLLRHCFEIGVKWDDFDPIDVGVCFMDVFSKLVWEVEEGFEEGE